MPTNASGKNRFPSLTLLALGLILISPLTTAAQKVTVSAATHASRIREAPAYVYNEDSSERTISLPADYRAALEKVAPGFRPLTNANEFEKQWGHPFSLIADINGDRAPEVALAGTVNASTLTVVLLYTSPTGVRGAILTKRLVSSTDERSPDGGPRVEETLSIEKQHGRIWIRWQDGDCKGLGWQWTVKAGVVTKIKSDCEYGD